MDVNFHFPGLLSIPSPYMESKRSYGAEEKLKIVLEGMSGTISVSDLCRKYHIKPARFCYWKDQPMKSAHEISESGAGRSMRIA